MTPPATMIAIDAAGLARLEAKIDALQRAIAGATVQPAPEWVSIPEAARRLGCSPSTIRRKLTTGELEAQGAGKLRRVRISN